MTIYNLFRNAPFGPEEISVLATAYEQTLRALGLKQREDPLTELVAKKIISISQTGVRDPAILAERAIAEFALPE